MFLSKEWVVSSFIGLGLTSHLLWIDDDETLVDFGLIKGLYGGLFYPLANDCYDCFKEQWGLDF